MILAHIFLINGSKQKPKIPNESSYTTLQTKYNIIFLGNRKQTNFIINTFPVKKNASKVCECVKTKFI